MTKAMGDGVKFALPLSVLPVSGGREDCSLRRCHDRSFREHSNTPSKTHRSNPLRSVRADFLAGDSEIISLQS